MGTPHKHRDVIIAWANGEEIQFMFEGTAVYEWIDFDFQDDRQPDFNARGIRWRVKPKIVKREGWVALYGNGYDGAPSCCGIYGNETECQRMNPFAVRTVRVEWEEPL